MATVPKMGLECDMEDSGEELLLDDPGAVTGSNRSRRRAWVAVASLITMCVCTATWQHSGAVSKADSSSLIGLSEEEIDTDVNCQHLPHVHLYKVISSNLGKQGPDKDAPEGIIYKAKTMNIDDDFPEYELHLHSVKSFDDEDDDSYDDAYRPAFTHGEYVNGLHGKFAGINMKPNKTLKFRVHAFNVTSQTDMIFPMGVVTFFDIDDGANTLKEHVSVRGYQAYYLTKTTELKVTHDAETRFTTFTGSTEGDGSDNPTEPFSLTKQQQDRAVTFEFPAVSEFNFEIGCSAGETDRVFSFAFRPSLTCDNADAKKVYPYEHLHHNAASAEDEPRSAARDQGSETKHSGATTAMPAMLAFGAVITLIV